MAGVGEVRMATTEVVEMEQMVGAEVAAEVLVHREASWSYSQITLSIMGLFLRTAATEARVATEGMRTALRTAPEEEDVAGVVPQEQEGSSSLSTGRSRDPERSLSMEAP